MSVNVIYSVIFVSCRYLLSDPGLSGSANFSCLLSVVKSWADNCSSDGPVVYVEGEELNSKGVANHFEKQDRIGRLLLPVIQNAIVSGHKLEEIISGFEKNLTKFTFHPCKILIKPQVSPKSKERH